MREIPRTYKFRYLSSKQLRNANLGTVTDGTSVPLSAR